MYLIVYMSYLAQDHGMAHDTLSTNCITKHFQLSDSDSDDYNIHIMNSKKERMMKRYTYFSIYHLNLMDVELHLCGTDVLLRVCMVYICFIIVTECNAMRFVCMKCEVH